MLRFVSAATSMAPSSAPSTTLAPVVAPGSPSPERRELLIGLPSGAPGYVEIATDTTLTNVRDLIQNEFDEDMYPAEFFFVLDGVRISQKQEGRKQVWTLAASSEGVRVHLKDRKQVSVNPVVLPQKREAEAQESTIAPPCKRIKIQLPESQGQGMEEKHSNESPQDPKPSESVAMETDGEPHVAGMEEKAYEEPRQEDVTVKSNKPAPVSPNVDDKEDEINPTDSVPPPGPAAPRKILDDENGVAPTVMILADDSRAVPNDDDSLHTYATPTNEHQDSECDNDMEVEPGDSKLASSTKDTATSQNNLDLNHYEKDTTRKETAAVQAGLELDITDINTESPCSSSSAVGEAKHRTAKANANEITLVSENDTHRTYNQALKQSRAVLHDIESLLEKNPLFCSEDRRTEWMTEIRTNIQGTAPHTVIGVLGNTGVGKSSLLNALLDEASVLPTSGSRGCTAAVVELRYNTDLAKPPVADAAAVEAGIYVYKGEVEFIRLQEWLSELKVLVEECSTNEAKTVYAQPPEGERQPDAAAAWSKINQVYGQGTMERYRGKGMQYVYGILSTNRRIVDLLTPDPATNQSYKSIRVQEGFTSREAAEKLLTQPSRRSRRERKKWAASFRTAINQYVYRKGNGKAPQTWPLIRKVVLQGPWPVLKTGACLVDLPGVRDANAARAKVSESYLQNCSQIWVVAPIKRAVDDGTAKELLGEQFKRRLLMDGQYGNVSFICTQTDDCETTEIMRDHQDVAMQQEGRWEKMTELRDELGGIEKELSDLVQVQEDLQQHLEDCEEDLVRAKEEVKESREEAKDNDEDCIDLEGGNEEMEHVLKVEQEAKERVQRAKGRLRAWADDNNEKIDELEERVRVQQRQLKSICATVRNEFSKAALQEDFRAGLKELYRRDDEDEGRDNAAENPVPEDINMDVFCISANDYLKIAGIKPSSDGPSNTFSDIGDTQIPILRDFVHLTTARYRKTFVEQFVNSVSDMVDRVKLLAGHATSKIPRGRIARKYKAIFDYELIKLETGVKKVASDFRERANQAIKSSLHPSLKLGAQKGQASAMQTVDSWGSKNRRTRNERAPDQNGLYWSTYEATIRRDGVYNSQSAGAIDMNQELCDPMEKEFGTSWQQTMVSVFRNFLVECEQTIFVLCSELDKALVAGLAEAGLEKPRLGSIANTGTRTYTTAVRASFVTMKSCAQEKQRNLNRSLLPLVQARMRAGYSSTLNAPRGTGVFNRMKTAMHNHSTSAVRSMFDESARELIDSIDKMVENVVGMILGVTRTVSNHLSGVYSVCWEGHCDSEQQVNDPALQEKVRDCRDKLLPSLNQLRKKQDDTMGLLGLETEDLELDVTAVASLDTRLEESFQKAEEAGEVIDLYDDDGGDIPSSLPLLTPPCKIKADPDAAPNSSVGATEWGCMI